MAKCNTIKNAPKAQILGEYNLIKDKKSKLSRDLRDRVVFKVERNK